MIVGEFLDGQGLGNQLFLYLAVRSTARRLGCGFAMIGSERFKGNSFLSIDFGLSEEELSLKYGDINSSFTNYNEPIIRSGFFGLDESYFDEAYDDILPMTLLRGFFQHESYHRYISDCLGSIILLRSSLESFEFLNSDRVCLLNVRGGEYISNRRLTLHRAYWESCMRVMRSRGVEKFYIATDDEDYSKKLLPGVPVIKQGVAGDFLSVLCARNLIISNSSFPLVPIFMKGSLGNGFILAPMYWAMHNYSSGRWGTWNNIYAHFTYVDRHGTLINGGDLKKGLIEAREKYFRSYSDGSDFKLGFFGRLLYRIWIRVV